MYLNACGIQGAYCVCLDWRSMLSDSFNVIALAATATFVTLSVVTQRLSLYKPAIVAASPNRANVKLTV